MELAKKTDTVLQTLSLAHLANLFLGAGLPEITLQYLHKILLFYPGLMNQKKAEVNWPLTWALERGGQAFLQLNQVDSALKIAEVLHIPFEEQDNTNHLFNGLLYAALKKYEKALPHFKQGYLVAKQRANPIALTSHAGELGRTYLALKDFKKAIYYTEEALQVAQKIHAVLEMKNAARTLTESTIKQKIIQKPIITVNYINHLMIHWPRRNINENYHSYRFKMNWKFKNSGQNYWAKKTS